MPAPKLPTSAPAKVSQSTSTGGQTLTGDPTKNNLLVANTSRVTLVGGPLDDTYIVYDPSDVVVEQNNGGIDTVQTWGSGFTLPANVENLQLMGTFNANAVGNSGNNLITANTGNDHITTGGGNDVLVAGAGADRFTLTKDLGTTTWITGLKTSGTVIDKIDLYGYGFQGFDSLRNAMTQVGSDVKIDLGGGQSLMLDGKTVASITPQDVNVENTKAGLHLTFDDEFNNLSLNTGTPATAGNTWNTTLSGGERTLKGNNELELYVDPDYKGTSSTALGLNPFSVSNGVAEISARPADPSVQPSLGGYKYTSGVLTTKDSFSQTYGYFEARIKVPEGQGLWPAFWLLPENPPAIGTRPDELDVMEQIGSNTSNISNGVYGDGHVFNQGTNVDANTSDGFHTYGMDWTAQTISFYFDGQLTYQVATPSDMNQPMYMILNLAVGGNWPGSPNGTTDWANADVLIDYVRAYSHDPNAAPAPMATLSNATDATDLSSKFNAGMTGPGTSTTYTVQQLGLAGVLAGTTVTVAYDANNDQTVTNNGAWNAIKNATVVSPVNGDLTVNNFVDAEISFGNGDSTIRVNGAKRGSITTGNGDSTITVAATSNTNDSN
ncbi:MAG: family 16 glycosylhydrolase, partial [Dongiaceae bacterium]